MELWVQILFAVAAVFGVFATLMPTVPGIPYMFVLAVIYALLDKFQTFTWQYLLALGIIMVISILTDYLSGIIGAKYGGASRRSLFVGFACLVLGTIIAPPFGGFLGLFLGVLVSEFLQLGEHIRAFKAAGYSLVGALVGTLINFTLAIIFFIVFLVFMF